MQTVTDYPPNIGVIEQHFPVNDNVIFAYAPNVYVPSGAPLTLPLQEHEKVHLRQQGDNPADWWERYLEDIQFRYDMELEAHQREYKVACAITPDRNQRANYLREISRRLSGPLYGAGVTLQQAMRDIRGA